MNDTILKNYVTKWNLSSPQLIAETATSHVYSVHQNDVPLIIKIFTQIGIEDESGSIETLSTWQGNGAVKLIEADSGALLLEKLFGPNLYQLSLSGQEDKATSILVDIIRKIHSIEPDSKAEGIVDLQSIFSPLNNINAGFPEHSLLHTAKKIGENLLKTTTKKVLLHGDLHHENVMKRVTGEHICYDPKGYIGDPAYEIATILKNPWGVPEISESEDKCLKRAEIFSKELDLPLDRILAFAFVHMCLSILWSYEDKKNKDYSHQLKIAQFLKKHVAEKFLV